MRLVPSVIWRACTPPHMVPQPTALRISKKLENPPNSQQTSFKTILLLVHIVKMDTTHAEYFSSCKALPRTTTTTTYNARQFDVNLSPLALLKDPLVTKWDLLPTMQWVGSWFFCEVERRFHIREWNCQPLCSDLGTFSLSSSSLGLSQTEGIPNIGRVSGPCCSQPHGARASCWVMLWCW